MSGCLSVWLRAGPGQSKWALRPPTVKWLGSSVFWYSGPWHWLWNQHRPFLVYLHKLCISYTAHKHFNDLTAAGGLPPRRWLENQTSLYKAYFLLYTGDHLSSDLWKDLRKNDNTMKKISHAFYFLFMSHPCTFFEGNRYSQQSAGFLTGVFLFHPFWDVFLPYI